MNGPGELTSRQTTSLRKAKTILSKMKPRQIVNIPGGGTYSFDMSIVNATREDCGTVGCILGLCTLLEEVAGRDDTWLSNHSQSDEDSPCYRLFYPPGLTDEKFYNLTPKDAAAAVGKFLKGNPHPFNV